MPGRIFSRSLLQTILDSSRELRLFADIYCPTITSFESPTTSQLHLPEVQAPAQYFIDVGLQPALAQQLSCTYMDSVDQYRNICQSHFDRATHGGGHLTEYYRKVFISLFKRTIHAWGSQILSIVRVRLCQVGAPQTTVCPECVDIRVDDAAKAEIIARLGLKATHLTSVKMVTSPSADVTSRLEEVSERRHALSTDTVDSRLMLPGPSPISSASRYQDPFSHVAPQTCFPAPYPPPPPPASCLPRNALPTSFISPTSLRNMRLSASHSPDVSTLINLFGRMTTTTLESDSRIPMSHRVFCTPDSDRIEPTSLILSPSVAANSAKSQPTGVESIASPTKPTSTARRRKIASLPTYRGKASASPPTPFYDSTGATSHPITLRPTECVVDETPECVFTSPQKTHLVSTPSSLYSAETSCVATSKPSTARQRRVHALHHKTHPQSQTFSQNQVLRPLVRVGEKISHTVSRSPPLVSDATSYFDSPPTSSDELETPPSTPPRSHVFLARTSTEGLALSSESDGIVSYKGPPGDAKPPNLRQRYMHLDFTNGGWGRDEQPLTFTFAV